MGAGTGGGVGVGVGLAGTGAGVGVGMDTRLGVAAGLPDVIRHGASLRQAGFAQAVLDGLNIVAFTAHEIAFNRTQRELRD